MRNLLKINLDQKYPELDKFLVKKEFSNPEYSYIINYSNNVIKITDCGKTYYFKESLVHRKKLESLYSGINIFFSEIIQDENLKNKVLQCLKDRKNLKKLNHIGKKMENSNFHKYLISDNLEFVGLFNEKKDILRKLVFFLSSIESNYFNHRHCKKGNYETINVSKYLAAKEISKLIGIEDFFVESEYVEFSLGGKIKRGILMEDAAGIDVSSITPANRISLMTPELGRELEMLNVYDVLIHDDDHRVDNYRVNGNHLKVFDNDSYNAFGPFFTMDLKSGVNIMPLIKNGFLNRKISSSESENPGCLNLEFLNKLKNLEFSDFNFLKQYLPTLNVIALKYRFSKIKKSISRKLVQSKSFNSFDESGKTYSKSFMTDCDYSSGLHLFDQC